MSDKLRVVHYINQFYAGVGGEEMAHVEPVLLDGEAKGPGMAIQGQFKDDLEIVATVYSGDSYFGENIEQATETILDMIKKYDPDLVITGPAFNAGRYGIAAGGVAKAVQDQLGIPVVTGMYEENPGADMYKKDVYVVSTQNSAVGMNDAIQKMVPLGIKLARGEEIGSPDEEGYIERGIRKNFFTEKDGAQRAADMLVKKLAGEEFETEYPMPEFDHVEPNPPIEDMSKATIAIVSSGGPVPFGNPDHIESSSASRYGKYSIEGIDDLVEGEWETAHGGYDATYADEDMDRVIPVDVLRNYEKEGKIGKLFDYFYSTVGNGTSVNNSKAFGEAIAEDMKANGVDAVILTSTWGTCTRCGATIYKEIERAGFPIAHMCTVTPISMTVGANRIVPTVAIPHPLGDPSLTPEEEYHLREKMVDEALKALQTDVKEQTVFDSVF